MGNRALSTRLGYFDRYGKEIIKNFQHLREAEAQICLPGSYFHPGLIICL
jgi:hypothetical protein